MHINQQKILIMKRFIFSLAVLLVAMGLSGYAMNKIKKLDFSIEQVIQEANAGSADAQCFLGYCLINGININVDYYKAAEWLSKAIAQGNKPAIYYLANIRYAIDGMDQEYKNAADCLRLLTNSAQIQSIYDNSKNFTLAENEWPILTGDNITSLPFDDNTFLKSLRIQANNDNPSAQYLIYSWSGEDKQQNIKLLKRAAELGHANAQYQLALELSKNNENSTDSEQIINSDVIKWLRVSADQGHLPAIKALAYCYGSDKKFHDDVKAVKYYLQAAIFGDKESQLIAGNYYYLGKGVTQNYAEAMKWYNTAVLGQDKDSYIFSESYRHLGDCYFYGNGVQQNYNKAIEYYKMSDFYGCGYTLATYYENNNQPTKAIEFYHQDAGWLACHSGDNEARMSALKLADYYYNGTNGMNQDYKQAAYFYSLYNLKLIDEKMDASSWLQKYYKAEEAKQEQGGNDEEETMLDLDKYVNFDIVKQARQGNVQAQLKLGKLFMQGVYEYEDVIFTFDLKHAASWLRKAANKGNAEAQYYLGHCLSMMQLDEETNESVQKEIIDLYQKAARAGIVKAQLALAQELENKDREEESYEESAEDYTVAEIDKPYAQWYLKAAQNGDPEAQYWMGNHNYDEAYYWFSKAAKQGHIDAMYDLAECYFEGAGDVIQDSEKGLELLTKAANTGHGLAAEKLADRYYKGEGVTRNYEKAVYWYTIAANANEILSNSRYVVEPDRAQNMLGQCYHDGNGVMRDYKKAVYWFRRAAECGNTDAQKNLSECYRKGLGVPVSTSQAAWWLKLSNRYDD